MAERIKKQKYSFQKVNIELFNIFEYFKIIQLFNNSIEYII